MPIVLQTWDLRPRLQPFAASRLSARIIEGRREAGGGILILMRDHSKLCAFELADQLTVLVYTHSRDFPRSEQFGLTSQRRRVAVCVPSNIVEGRARDSLADYIRFLDIAYGSARELEYQISPAHRLTFLSDDSHSTLRSKANMQGS